MDYTNRYEFDLNIIIFNPNQQKICPIQVMLANESYRHLSLLVIGIIKLNIIKSI